MAFRSNISDSLLDFFVRNDLHIRMITEHWFRPLEIEKVIRIATAFQRGTQPLTRQNVHRIDIGSIANDAQVAAIEVQYFLECYFRIKRQSIDLGMLN